MFQKIISTILIIGLVLSVNFNLFLIKPREARAFDIIGGPFNVLNLVKEVALDAVAWTIKDRVINVLKQKIVDWGTGRKSDAMQPFAVSDWVQYFKDAVALGAAKYITEFRQTEIEPRIKDVLVNLGFDTAAQDLAEYRQYARSTLKQDLGDDYQRFIDSGYSLNVGGWKSWFSLMKPQNNIFGQVLMAEQARRTSEQAEKEAADKEVIGGSIGYKSEKVTTKTDIEACKENCAAAGPPSPDCLKKCEQSPGIALETKIKNWGSTIEKSMTDAMSADMAKILQVDEISELLGIMFSALLNRAIDGMGMAFQAITAKSAQKTRAGQKEQFSYLRNFQKTQTPQQMQDVRGGVLNTILKAIQSLNRSGIYCKEDEMMKYTDWIKNVSDILHPSVESLYVGLTGANLQPDFEVLDPRFAPYTVYGYSWGEVPANKLPDRCRKITDQLNLGINATCRSIKSGLEPNVRSQCEQCMYDHDPLNCPPAPYPPQPYPTAGQGEPWTGEKSDYWWACKAAYNTTLNRCDDCLKKADEKCDRLTDKEETACIEANCSDYADLAVVSPPTSSLDFYNKCLIEEKKDACYTCLKEYYVPAAYCEDVGDYVSRAIDKYPTVVKRNRKGGDDKGEFWGPYDEGIAGRGDECDDNYDKQLMDLALLCRIMPDFSHGGTTCRNTCMGHGMTEEQLRDITDFRPHGGDCNGATVDIGGRNPWNPINDGAMHTRGKCCANFWQHDKEQYKICIGSGETVTVEEEEEETGACHDGERFNEFINEINPDEGEKGYTPFGSTNWNIDRKNTGVIDAPLDPGAYKNCIILRSSSKQVKEATVYITKPYCDAYREIEGGYRIYWSDVNGDGGFSNSLVDVHETHEGEALGYCCASSNPDDCPVGQSGGTYVSPPSDKILCTFDIDAEVGSSNGPTGIDPRTGEPYKVCCNLGPEIQEVTKQDCINAGLPSSVCNKGSRFYTSGLYIVAVPDQPDSLGGAEWCACEEPSKRCGAKCTSAMCTP